MNCKALQLRQMHSLDGDSLLWARAKQDRALLGRRSQGGRSPGQRPAGFWGLILGAQRPHMVHSVDGSALRPAAHDTMLAGKAQPVCLGWHLGPEG